MGIDVIFAHNPSFLDTGKYDVSGRLEENHEIGFGHRALEQVGETFVQPQFLTVERLFGKKLVLLIQVIRDDQIIEQLTLVQPHLLRVTAGEVEHLSGKGKARPVGVKTGEKRVVFAGFQNQLDVPFALKNPAKRRLSYTNQALDDDELGQLNSLPRPLNNPSDPDL